MVEDFDSRLAAFLSHENVRSGESIAAELGCSRTAVWKHIEALRGRGIEIEAVPGKGYLLHERLELLDEELIRSQLQKHHDRSIKKLLVLGAIDSSNTWLLSQAADDQHAVAVLAECQTAGRGRRGQPWISPFGRNVYASLGWRFEQGVGALGCLPLLLALSASNALERIGMEGHLIKWPNDIVLSDRKLAGCLVEIQGDVSGPCHAVMGVGINVRMPESAPGAKNIDQPWTDVSSIINEVSRNQLAGLLLDSLLDNLELFASDGFAPFLSQWKSRDALAGTQVRLTHPSGEIQGTAVGISERGGLVLQTAEGVGEYTAGEVSTRRKEQVFDHD